MMPLVTRLTYSPFWASKPCEYWSLIRRGMPWTQPRSLTSNQVYSLTAFILAKNKLIGETDVMNADTLPKVRMPNRNGFIVQFPDKI
jgi:S-disulfanyl-L-cysteine oxidoreductase SoxD